MHYGCSEEIAFAVKTRFSVSFSKGSIVWFRYDCVSTFNTRWSCAYDFTSL